MITIFTPTYNRAYILENLYHSLVAQTDSDFEWLIVDDGSIDHTEQLVVQFQAENKLDIRYYKQPNGGKHRAINRGVQLAKGELFFIVDSDDQLTENAVELVRSHHAEIADDNNFAGVSGMKCYFDGKRIGGEASFTAMNCSLDELRNKHHIKGDLAEVYRTSILAQYPFPEIEGEVFCPEALVWYQISSQYKLRFFNQNIYRCDYLLDGLTSKITRLRMDNPIGSMLTYKVMSEHSLYLRKVLRAEANFWRFFFCLSKPQREVYEHLSTYIGMRCRLIGYLLYLMDKRRNNG